MLLKTYYPELAKFCEIIIRYVNICSLAAVETPILYCIGLYFLQHLYIALVGSGTTQNRKEVCFLIHVNFYLFAHTPHGNQFWLTGSETVYTVSRIFNTYILVIL